jgi:hypothetical protein
MRSFPWEPAGNEEPLGGTFWRDPSPPAALANWQPLTPHKAEAYVTALQDILASGYFSALHQYGVGQLAFSAPTVANDALPAAQGKFVAVVSNDNVDGLVSGNFGKLLPEPPLVGERADLLRRPPGRSRPWEGLHARFQRVGRALYVPAQWRESDRRLRARSAGTRLPRQWSPPHTRLWRPSVLTTVRQGVVRRLQDGEPGWRRRPGRTDTRDLFSTRRTTDASRHRPSRRASSELMVHGPGPAARARPDGFSSRARW